MKRFYFSFLLSVFFLPSFYSISQIKNLKSMEGTWTGQWTNTRFGSTGSISLVITVNEINQTAHGVWDVGGDVLGVPPPRPSFGTDLTLTPTGFSINFISNIWGNITGTGLLSGTYSGSAANCPNPNAQAIAATGTFTNSSINGTFTFLWYGVQTNGTVQITKQNPVTAPSNLSGNENPKGTVNLTWQDNSTNETGFRIDRKNPATGLWTEIGTTTAGITTYQDKTVVQTTDYSYRVAAYNTSTESEYSSEFSIKTTDVKGTAPIPSDYLLAQNYPNPFNPATVIHYEVPRESKVIISVYTMLGEKISTLFNDVRTEGVYELKFEAGSHPSGIYLIKMVAKSLETGREFVDIKKMVLIK